MLQFTTQRQHRYHRLITILGPTACGKTTLGVRLAEALSGSILSADSRQLYRGMDLGTGKDLSSYETPRGSIPYHLIDVAPAGAMLSVHDYLGLFSAQYDEVVAAGRQPLMVGGTGLYMEQVLSMRPIHQVPPYPALRQELESLSLEDLKGVLRRYPSVPNVDLSSQRKTIRAIELARYYRTHPDELKEYKALLRAPRPTPPPIFGLLLPRAEVLRRIDLRLQQRLDEGMVAEVAHLMEEQVSVESLLAYGLEYRFITRHLLGDLSYEKMVEELGTAIHQFAKRQMIWFRGMERRGLPIHWLDGLAEIDSQVEQILRRVSVDR